MTGAFRYEALYPGTGITEPQKEERMDRLDLRAGSSTRSIVVPALPWRKDTDDGD